MSTLGDTTRRSLGAVGAHFPSVGITRLPSVADQREAARRLEAAGYPAIWVNEGVGGKDVFVLASTVLHATERATVGTDVANIWARSAQAAHAASAQLANGFPDRFVLGLGSGYPFQAAQVGRDYRPLAAMRTYLTDMPEPPPIDQPLDTPFARLIAANGPQMLALAASNADGALPALVPPSSTAATRATLGPDGLVVIAVSVIVDADREAAREAARRVLSGALSFPNSPYAANLIRLGYREEDVLGAADAVLDDVVAFGTSSDVAALVRAHHAAGADHVVLQPVVGDFAEQLAQLEQIAPGIHR